MLLPRCILQATRVPRPWDARPPQGRVRALPSSGCYALHLCESANPSQGLQWAQHFLKCSGVGVGEEPRGATLTRWSQAGGPEAPGTTHAMGCAWSPPEVHPTAPPTTAPSSSSSWRMPPTPTSHHMSRLLPLLTPGLCFAGPVRTPLALNLLGPLCSHLPDPSLSTLTSYVPLGLLLHVREGLPLLVLERPEGLRVRLGSPFLISPLEASSVHTDLQILSSTSGVFLLRFFF